MPQSELCCVTSASAGPASPQGGSGASKGLWLVDVGLSKEKTDSAGRKKALTHVNPHKGVGCKHIKSKHVVHNITPWQSAKGKVWLLTSQSQSEGVDELRCHFSEAL